LVDGVYGWTFNARSFSTVKATPAGRSTFAQEQYDIR